MDARTRWIAGAMIGDCDRPPLLAPMSERVRVTEEPCSQCPWKGRCRLSPGRLKDLREETKRKQGVFVCHKTMLANGGSTETFGTGPGAAVCSGWLELGDEPAEVQIAARLGYIALVDEEGKEA